MATTEVQPWRLQKWMLMAAQIDERLWDRRQNRCLQLNGLSSQSQTILPRDAARKFQSNSNASGPVPMELGAVCAPSALAKTAAERLEYQRQGHYWGCGELGHI